MPLLFKFLPWWLTVLPVFTTKRDRRQVLGAQLCASPFIRVNSFTPTLLCLYPHLTNGQMGLKVKRWGTWQNWVWIWSGRFQCPYTCSMPLIQAVLHFELTFERWTKISRAKKEREGGQCETPALQQAGVRCKWKVVPGDWIINNGRVIMGEVRFERQ